MNAPDGFFLDKRSNLMAAIKEDNLALAVVYNVLDDRVEVVTAFKTSSWLKNRKHSGEWPATTFFNQSQDDDLFIDLDGEGNIVGIEIWQASKNIAEPMADRLVEKIKKSLEIVAK